MKLNTIRLIFITLNRFIFFMFTDTIGVNENMSSLNNTRSDAETLKYFAINIAVIFGVTVALIMISEYFAGT